MSLQGARHGKPALAKAEDVISVAHNWLCFAYSPILFPAGGGTIVGSSRIPIIEKGAATEQVQRWELGLFCIVTRPVGGGVLCVPPTGEDLSSPGHGQSLRTDPLTIHYSVVPIPYNHRSCVSSEISEICEFLCNCIPRRPIRPPHLQPKATRPMNPSPRGPAGKASSRMCHFCRCIALFSESSANCQGKRTP